MEKSKVKTDCFAYRRGECGALYELICENRRCSFYKNCEQFNHDKIKYSYKGRVEYWLKSQREKNLKSTELI